MSGHTKQNLYYAFSLLFGAAALAGVILLAVFYVPAGGYTWREWLVEAVFLVCIALRIPAAIHEIGHLLLGLLCGMKCTSVTLCYLNFSADGVHIAGNDHAGAITAFPRKPRHVRGKLLMFTLGGSLLNLLLGGALLALCLALPYHPACFFAGLLAPFLLYEGISALMPCDLPAGKTDGAVFLGLMKKRPEEETLLRVIAAQGMLYLGTFSELKKELLFGAPVVREDLPAGGALKLLQAQYFLAAKEEGTAEEILSRLVSSEDTAPEIKETAVRYQKYFCGGFSAERSGFYGIDRLEKELVEAQRKKFSAAGATE